MVKLKVAKVGIKKESGYLYFIDKKGDISCAKMVRGGKKKKRKTKRRAAKKRTTKRKATRKKATKRKAAKRK